MLDWLKSLFGFGGHGVYRPRERNIYRYWNGERAVNADPMVIHKRLMDRAADLRIDMKVASSTMLPAPETNKAYLAVVKAVRDCFSLKHPPEDSVEVENTLSQVEAVELLVDFQEFCEGLKKNLKRTAIPPTATPPLSVPSSAAVPPTANGSASGSTANGPSTAVPGPLPTGPPSPSASSIPESSITGP